MSVVELEGAYNVRDLGGLRIAGNGLTPNGIIYRGDSLDHLTARDRQILFKDLRIHTIIDLRTKAEITRPADWINDDVTCHHFSLIHENRIGKEPFPSDNPNELAKVYLGNVRDGRDAVAHVFNILGDSASKGVPCIFHCAAGRDRTGVISALLLSLVDVQDSDIAADYILSNRHAHHVTARLAINPLYDNQKSPDGVILLKRETILLFLKLIREEFGGAGQFLIDCGVPMRAIGELRESFGGRRLCSAA